MRSAALRHFPRITVHDGQRMLWNPVLRKAFKNRPEERVRLRLIDFLVLEAGWSPHRISVELSLRLRRDENLKRADILCYYDDFSPALLIECKAERVTMGNNTGNQIAAYNSKINAPFLMVSNGIDDLFFKIESEKEVLPLMEIPDILPSAQPTNTKDFVYWKDRGFAGKDASPSLRPWLTPALNWFWETDDKNTDTFPRYLEFRNRPGQVPLDHYYRLFTPDKKHKMAVSFIASIFGGSHLVGIINSNGTNTGVIEINLDLLSEGSELNTTIFSDAGERVANASPFIPLDFHKFNPGQLADLPGKLLELFRQSHS